MYKIAGIDILAILNNLLKGPLFRILATALIYNCFLYYAPHKSTLLKPFQCLKGVSSVPRDVSYVSEKTFQCLKGVSSVPKDVSCALRGDVKYRSYRTVQVKWLPQINHATYLLEMH